MMIVFVIMNITISTILIVKFSLWLSANVLSESAGVLFNDTATSGKLRISSGGSLLNQVGLFYWKENISMVKN